MYKKSEYGEVGQKKKLVNVFEQNMLNEKAELERLEAMRVKPKGKHGEATAIVELHAEIVLEE